MRTMTKDLKKFIEIFGKYRKPCQELLSRMGMVTYDGLYDTDSFYLIPMRGLTKERATLFIRRQNVTPQGATWSLSIQRHGKTDLDSIQEGLSGEAVLRNALAIVNEQ